MQTMLTHFYSPFKPFRIACCTVEM